MRRSLDRQPSKLFSRTYAVFRASISSPIPLQAHQIHNDRTRMSTYSALESPRFSRYSRVPSAIDGLAQRPELQSDLEIAQPRHVNEIIYRSFSATRRREKRKPAKKKEAGLTSPASPCRRRPSASPTPPLQRQARQAPAFPSLNLSLDDPPRRHSGTAGKARDTNDVTARARSCHCKRPFEPCSRSCACWCLASCGGTLSISIIHPIRYPSAVVVLSPLLCIY